MNALAPRSSRSAGEHPSDLAPGARTRLALALLMGLLACAKDPAAPTAARITEQAPRLSQLGLHVIASGLNAPVYLTSPAGDARLFIVQKTGIIRVYKNGALLPTPFLNLSGQVSTSGERGLLSMAFHPRYASNGFFYVDYTDRTGDIRVVRYRVSGSNPDRADPASAMNILTIPHRSFSNHNGGLVMFGPDGKLYLGTGDGGGGGDPLHNGQRLSTLLGKLLRIDVDAGRPYAIPPDNPFVHRTGARGEIWAYGLRNPWRFAFDPSTSRLYIADVGQSAWEEVDIQGARAAGLNYGWPRMEGRHCFSPRTNCNMQGLTLPQFEYSHTQGCAIIGGFVYRGSRIPTLVGRYVYADLCSGWVRSFFFDGRTISGNRQLNVGRFGSPNSFGEDSAHELYLLSQNGNVYRIDPPV
jgi:glucose/arabinose dehydrogenase